MIDYLNNQWWIAIFLYAILSIGDHFMTVYAAKLHKKYASRYLCFQHGYELNPRFEKEIAEFRWFTRKHLLLLLVVFLIIFILGRAPGEKFFYEFCIGMFLLPHLSIDLRHVRNIIFIRDIRKPDSLKGKLEYSYWISQRSSATEFITVGILFCVAALATMRPFFWGGVAGCLLMGIRGFRLANRKFPETTSSIQ